MMDSKLVALLFIVLRVTYGFSPPSYCLPSQCASSVARLSGLPSDNGAVRYGATRLLGQQEGDDVEQQEDPAAEASDEANADGEDESEENETEEEESAEDPEVEALKQEIANLESELRSKRREVSRALETAERYTKAGYARRVAEMQNMRKTRRSLESLNQFSSQAQVVSNFLPVLDELKELKEVYAQNEFAQQYKGLLGAFSTLLKKELQVEEYEAGRTGDPFDESRSVAVEEEFSDEFEMGTIIRPTKMGMELQGNIMRMAECVVSLGSVENAQKVVGNAKKAAEDAEAAAADRKAEVEGEAEGDEEQNGA